MRGMKYVRSTKDVRGGSCVHDAQFACRIVSFAAGGTEGVALGKGELSGNWQMGKE